MPVFWPDSRLGDGRAWIAEGAAKAGRDPSEIATSPFTTVIPIPGKGASSKARELISFYIGGMGDYYKQLLSGFGYADECNEIERLYRDKATRKMAPDAVTDDMIEALTISGDPGCRGPGWRPSLQPWRERNVALDTPLAAA